MLYTDMFGKYRFYVRGTEDKLKEFTVDLAWYHSAIGEVASVNEHNNGELTLNLVVHPEHYGDDLECLEKWIRKLVEKHNLIGFSTWKEYKAMEATA